MPRRPRPASASCFKPGFTLEFNVAVFSIITPPIWLYCNDIDVTRHALNAGYISTEKRILTPEKT